MFDLMWPCSYLQYFQFLEGQVGVAEIVIHIFGIMLVWHSAACVLAIIQLFCVALCLHAVPFPSSIDLVYIPSMSYL